MKPTIHRVIYADLSISHDCDCGHSELYMFVPDQFNNPKFNCPLCDQLYIVDDTDFIRNETWDLTVIKVVK